MSIDHEKSKKVLLGDMSTLSGVSNKGYILRLAIE